MELRIALAGNPNCGKTTLFNALTGANAFVGNWPGVTVEKKEGRLKKHEGVILTDLPGIYSLSPYTLEEVVARNYLVGERPDAILNIVDGTNLERNLYLTTQLTELGIPVVIAINMIDVVEKNGDKIDVAALSEALYQRMTHQAVTVSDMSAVITGLLLAFNLPATLPWWMAIVGAFIAIVIVKQLFGGIGMNFANPALVGRIVLFVSFASSMNNWVFPDAAVDQLSSATPLAVADKSKLSLLDLFMGIHGGVLGETCALAIVLGLVYLVATKTISIAIPASYVGSMFVFYLIATRDLHAALAAVLSGGLLFGAVFMATDYVTSPFTLKGKLVYGVALGIVTFAIRYWGSYTEGVSFALLFMNLWVPYINDLTRQTPYGYVKPAKKAKEGADK